MITSTTASIRRALEQMYPTRRGRAGDHPSSHRASACHRPQILGEPHILSFEEIDRLSEEKLTYLDVQRASEGTRAWSGGS